MYKIQIVHIITDLGTGGAESILFHLLKATYKQTDCIVISLKSGGFYKSKIELLGVPVYELNMFGLGSSLLAFIKLYRILSLHRNSVVQTWLYHADFMGGVVAKLVGVKKIIWGIHNTTLMPGKTKFFTRLLVKLLSKLSWFIPDKIVCCANLAAEIHVKQGYSRKKILVIHNGYDHEEFYVDRGKGELFRKKYNISNRSFCIGMVARNDPQKDYKNLLLALKELDADDNWVCLIVGSGVQSLSSFVRDLKLDKKVILFGECNDIPSVMNCLDLNVLSSLYGEAFPNVIAEAMLCGVPCICTDLGDVKLLVGQYGWIVPVANYEALSRAIICAKKESVTNDWAERKMMCRKHVIVNFSLAAMIKKYLEVWHSTK